MNVLLTGATGFIGSHIARALAKTGGWDITALVRPRADLRFLRRFPVRLVEGDLAGTMPSAADLADCDRVVHAGGKVADWGDYRDFFRANVLGSLRLFDLTPPGAGFIHISSNAVLGEEDEKRPKGARAPYRPVYEYPFEAVVPSAMNHYRLTKALAEMLLIRRARLRGRALTVVRPVWVYGPREFHAGPYEFCRSVLAGMPLMPGSGTNRFHVVYAGDLASLVTMMAGSMRDGVRVYNVGHPEVPLMIEYWREFCAALGRPLPRLVPKALLALPALALEFLATLVGAKEAPLFTRSRLAMFFDNNVYDVRDVLEDFPMARFTPHAVGVARTVRWWRMNGFL
jgi:nucleoside-diphosphate-sugar epimerase